MYGETPSGVFSFASLLLAMSTSYGAIAKMQAKLFENGVFESGKLPCMVISIGNIVAGGSGKTPMTIYLAQLLKKMGVHPAVLSRGYKGKAEKKGTVVSNGVSILKGPHDAGDEPYLIARTLSTVPVLVGASRYQSGLTAIKHFHSKVIVLDDGFQHHKLMKDLNIVLLDSQRPFGNGFLLPRGPLREPLSALKRADAFVLTRHEDQNIDQRELMRIAKQRPIFKSIHIPKIKKVIIKHSHHDNGADELRTGDRKLFLNRKKVIVFSGLAKNDIFEKTVRAFNCDIARIFSFQDHHPYLEKDIERIVEDAKRLKVDAVVTTEKDAVKIPAHIQWPADLVIVGIDLKIVEENEFRAFISDQLKKNNAI